MNEQGEGDAERPASSTSAHPQDGSIDFTRYSTEQLLELQHGIDGQAFPQNFANLADELAQRQDREASTAAIDGRFSARDGLVGWLEAKGRRAPLYGAGSIEVDAEQVTLCGWRRTWLGAAEQAVMEIALDDIRNVVRDPLDITQALARTCDWRRAVPGSVAADLAEIQVFESWAWSVRGTGGANSVSPQAWALFGHRAALAAAGLQDVQERAASNPVWYHFPRVLELIALSASRSCEQYSTPARSRHPPTCRCIATCSES